MEQNYTINQLYNAKALETEKSRENINNNLSKLLDSTTRLESKLEQQKADVKTITLDTQLHQAVIMDIITIMKDFIQNFIPSLLTKSKYERMSLIPFAEEFYNRFNLASFSLNDGFQLNRKIANTTAFVNNVLPRIDHRSSSVLLATAPMTSNVVDSSNI